MKLSVLTLCVLGACSMSAYASTTNLVNAQSQFLMSHNGNKDDSSNVRKNGSYCETKTLNIVHNIEQDKTYQGVGIKKIDKVTGTYQTVCVKDGKQTFAPPYTQTYINDITYEYQCTRRSEEKFEHYASDCVTSKNIYSNGIIGNAVRLMRFRGEENSDSSYSNLPSYDRVVNSCETMTLESRGTPVDACPLPIGSTGTPDVIRIEDISNQNSVATIRITDNRNTTDATINYKSTKINLSKEWLDQLERVTIKNAKAKDWMFVTLKNPVGVNAGVETILQMPYAGNLAEPPQLHLCNNSERFNWGSHSVSGSKVQDLSLIFNSIAGYKNISTTGNLSISQYPCEVTADRTGDNLAKSRFPIVQGRHWEMNSGNLSATWDEPERVEGIHGIGLNGAGQFIKDFQTRQCNHDPYQPTEDREICKLGDDLHPFIYNAQNQRKGIERKFGVYVKQDILPLLQQGFNNIEILTIGRDKNMELTLEFTFKGNKPSISKKIEDEKNNCYGRGHDASCHEQENENENSGGHTPMIPPHELDLTKSYKGWVRYYCHFGNLKKIGTTDCENYMNFKINPSERLTRLLDEGQFGGIKTGLAQHEHDTIVNGCRNRTAIYGALINQDKEKEFQTECEKEFHPRFTQCLKSNSDNHTGILNCFQDEEKNIQSWSPKNILKDIVKYQCDHLYTGKEECKKHFNQEIDSKQFTCFQGDAINCAKTFIERIKGFQSSNDTPQGKNSDYIGWINYRCGDEVTIGEGYAKYQEKFEQCVNKWRNIDNLVDNLIKGTSYQKDLGHEENTGILKIEHKEIIKACNNLLNDYEERLGSSIKAQESPQQLNCRNTAHQEYRKCLNENHNNYRDIEKCFSRKKTDINNYIPTPLFEPLIDEQCGKLENGQLQCKDKFTNELIKNNYKCPEGRTTECISNIIQKIKNFKPEGYYNNKPTDYDGWISYICNGDASCIGKWKSSSLVPTDLESELKQLGENGLLVNEHNQIRAWCNLRASGLFVKDGRPLESICYNEIVEKHKSCLIENKGNLQAIQSCFNNKQGAIRNWYNEGFMLTYVQSQCKEAMKDNEEHIRQCNAQFNLGYIKNFMNDHKDNSNDDPLHLNGTLPGIYLAISKFKPVSQGENNNTSSIDGKIKDRCIYLYNRGQTNGASTQACIENLRHQYKVCAKKTGQYKECRSKINEFNM